MRLPSPLAGRTLPLALLTLVLAAGLGAASAGCDANTEEHCQGGPCGIGSGGSGGSAGSAGGSAGSTGGSTGSTGGGAACLSPEGGDFPCEVFAILEAQCHVCHNAIHEGGAPIDLLTCDRFSECACGSTTKARAQVAVDFVTSDFMPLGADNNLSADDKAVLLGWLEGGAVCVPAGEGCTADPGAKACGP